MGMGHLGFSTVSLSFLKKVPSFCWVIDVAQFLGRQYGLYLLGVLNRMQEASTDILNLVPFTLKYLVTHLAAFFPLGFPSMPWRSHFCISYRNGEGPLCVYRVSDVCEHTRS